MASITYENAARTMPIHFTDTAVLAHVACTSDRERASREALAAIVERSPSSSRERLFGRA